MKENNNKYCPYCGAPVPTPHGVVVECDGCGHAFFHAHALTGRQIDRALRVPVKGIVWAIMSIALFAAMAFMRHWSSFKMASWQGLFIGLCLAAMIAFAVTTIGYIAIRLLFGHVAAKPLDRMSGAMIYTAGLFGFWPFLSFVLYVL